MKSTLGLFCSITLFLCVSPIAVADRAENLERLPRIERNGQALPSSEAPLGEQHLQDRLSAIEPRYTDRDIAELTVFGFGKAAEMNPALAQLFQTNNPRGIHPTEGQVGFIYKKLLEKIPDYHHEVSLKLQSGDPYLTKQAILTTATALREIEKDYAGRSRVSDYTPYGWHDTHAYTEMNGVAVLNAAVYANVTLATEIAFVLFFTPGAVSYRFPKIANMLDGELFVAQLCKQFKK